MNSKYLELNYKYCEMFEQNDEDVSIFPPYWFDKENDIEDKINILEECIQKHKLIKDVSPNYVEGIRIDTK